MGLRAAAGMWIICNALIDIIDRYVKLLRKLSKCLEIAFKTEKATINTSIEEAVRRRPAFSLSTLLQKADPAVRRVAELGLFSVISPFEKRKVPLLCLINYVKPLARYLNMEQS